MSRIEEARRWIESLTPEELAEKVKEAKQKYKNKVPKKLVYQIATSKDPKAEKLLKIGKIYLVTMYLEEH